MNSRLLLCLLYLGAFALPATAQQIRRLLPGTQSDSSFYTIARVDANEFWVGGENGTLKCVDTLGNISELRLPVPGRHILQIVPDGRYVYLAADRGYIFRYDRLRDQWIHADYSGQSFGKLTFYDLVVLEDGSLLVAGGHHRVAKGKVALPRGFVARLQPDLLAPPEIVWSHGLQFVFALEPKPETGEILFAASNGWKSEIYSSIDNGLTFQMQAELPGMVHHLMWHENALWYAGSGGLRFDRTGIAGRVGEGNEEMPGEGCIWSLLPLGDQVYSLAYNGAIVAPGASFASYSYKVRPAQTSLYEAAMISEAKALIVGHAQTLLLMELEPDQESALSLRVRDQQSGSAD